MWPWPMLNRVPLLTVFCQNLLEANILAEAAESKIFLMADHDVLSLGSYKLRRFLTVDGW